MGARTTEPTFALPVPLGARHSGAPPTRGRQMRCGRARRIRGAGCAGVGGGNGGGGRLGAHANSHDVTTGTHVPEAAKPMGGASWRRRATGHAQVFSWLGAGHQGGPERATKLIVPLARAGPISARTLAQGQARPGKAAEPLAGIRAGRSHTPRTHAHKTRLHPGTKRIRHGYAPTDNKRRQTTADGRESDLVTWTNESEHSANEMLAARPTVGS